jgi:hypothetical protein
MSRDIFENGVMNVSEEYTVNKKNIFFTPVGTPPNQRFVFCPGHVSGDCEGCRIRSLDLLVRALSTDPLQLLLSHNNT